MNHSLKLRVASRQVVNIEGIVPLFISIGDLRVGSWSAVLQNLAVDVMFVTSFIDNAYAAKSQLNTNSPFGKQPLWRLFGLRCQIFRYNPI